MQQPNADFPVCVAGHDIRQIMTSIDVFIKHDDLVTICDVTEHVLPSNSAEEGLMN